MRYLSDRVPGREDGGERADRGSAILTEQGVVSVAWRAGVFASSVGFSLALVLGLVAPAPAWANGGNTLYVNQDVPTGDGTSCASPGFATIQSAVNTANSGARIRICGSASHFRPGEVSSGDKSLTFVGDGPTETIIDGQSAPGGERGQIFTGGQDLTFESMTIMNGLDINDGGAIESRSGTLTVRNVHFVDNENIGFGEGGGAIRSGDLVVEDSIFEGNVSDRDTEAHGQGLMRGGAIYADGKATIRDSLFIDNEVPGQGGAGQGGAVWAQSVTIRGSVFEGNEVRYTPFGDQAPAADGGAVYAPANTVVVDSLFDGNYAQKRGGAIFSAGSVSFVRSNFTGNETGNSGEGGALFAGGGDVSVHASSITGGVASRGPAIDAGEHRVTITRSTLNGNSGPGAIYAGDISLTNSTLTGNVGGATLLAIRPDADLGGIEMLSSTFAGNALPGELGKITTDGTLAVGNSIIDETVDAELFACDAGSMDNLDGNVIANGAIGCEPLVGPPFGFCGAGDGEAAVCSTPATTVPSEAIGLGDLGDYGGPTETMRLATDSVAIDAGLDETCPPEDQRGVDRAGGCDSGAFQLTEWNLSVERTGSGGGAVTSTPAGIDCGTECVDGFTESIQVTLSAEPAAGSTFAGWSGACSGIGECVVTMDQVRSVRAEFTTLPNRERPTIRLAGKPTFRSIPVLVGCGGPSTCRLRVTGYVRGPGNTQGSPKLVTLVTVPAQTRRRVEVLKSNRTADPATRRKVQRKIREARVGIFDVTALDVTTGRQGRVAIKTKATGAEPV